MIGKGTPEPNSMIFSLA